MKRLVLGLAAAGLLAVFPFEAAAQAQRGHVVQEIQLDGTVVSSAAGVLLTPHEGTARTGIHQGEAIPDGMRIDVPAHVTVIVTSSGGKSTATLEPGSSVTFISTGSGEAVSRNAGKIIFSIVPGALDFFHVQSGESLTASVHGTVFSIESTGDVVTFVCSRGSVGIERSGLIQVGSVESRASLIDVISSERDQSVSYEPKPIWFLAKFDTFAQAHASYEQQLTSARATGNDQAIAAALRNIGVVEYDMGRYAQALESYREAIAISHRLGDRDGEAYATLHLGLVQARLGRFDDGSASEQAALATFRELGDRKGEAHALEDLGFIDGFVGRYQDSLTALGASVALFRTLGDRGAEAWALNTMGFVQDHAQQFSDALASAQQALALFRDVGDRDGEAHALMRVGKLETSTGRPADALAIATQTVELMRAIGDRDGEAWTLEMMGRAERDLKRFDESLASFQRALPIFREIGDREGEVAVLRNSGTTLKFLGRYRDALSSLTAALALSRELGVLPDEAWCNESIGGVEWKLNDRGEAKEYYHRALTLYNQLGDHESVQRVQSYLRRLGE